MSDSNFAAVVWVLLWDRKLLVVVESPDGDLGVVLETCLSVGEVLLGRGTEKGERPATMAGIGLYFYGGVPGRPRGVDGVWVPLVMSPVRGEWCELECCVCGRAGGLACCLVPMKQKNKRGSCPRTNRCVPLCGPGSLWAFAAATLEEGEGYEDGTELHPRGRLRGPLRCWSD